MQYDDFVLEQLVEAGALGKVYRAIEKSSGEIVAIKTLRKSHLSDSRAVEHFLQEAQILAELRHPGIVGVRGLGASRRRSFSSDGVYRWRRFAIAAFAGTAGDCRSGENRSFCCQGTGLCTRRGIVHCD